MQRQPVARTDKRLLGVLLDGERHVLVAAVEGVGAHIVGVPVVAGVVLGVVPTDEAPEPTINAASALRPVGVPDETVARVVGDAATREGEESVESNGCCGAHEVQLCAGMCLQQR